MSGETERNESGWTVDTLKYLQDERQVHARELQEANDRRLTEVAVEREKALKIKESADEKALDLAKQIQDYKDERANNLREQILGTEQKYATKDDFAKLDEKFLLAIKPISDFVTAQQGISINRGDTRSSASLWIAGIGAVIFFGAFVVALIALIYKP